MVELTLHALQLSENQHRSRGCQLYFLHSSHCLARNYNRKALIQHCPALG